MPRSRVSYSSTVPTSRRSEVALPPTATAWAGCSTSTPAKMSSMRSRTLRISAAEGGSEAISSSARTPEPTRQERTSSTPSETVPRIISVEPPPTSTTPIRPSTGWPRALVAPMKASRPSSSSLSTSTLTPAASPIAAPPRRRWRPRGPPRWRRRGSLGPELARQPHLGGDDLADLLDLLGKDLPLLAERLVDPRIGPLLHHLLQLPIHRLRHEHARGVGADIYGGAEHRPVIHHVPKPPGSHTGPAPGSGRPLASLDAQPSDARRPRTRGRAP